MSLFNDLQSKRQQHRVELNVLTLLVGELETAAKRDGSEVTDAKVVAGAKKLIKSVEETIRLKNGVDTRSLEVEARILRQFLPKELSEADLLQALKVGNPATLGEAMKYLEANHAGQYDKGLASKVAKQHLS